MSNTSTGREIEGELDRIINELIFGIDMAIQNKLEKHIVALTAKTELEALIASHTNAARIEMLDRIEESVKQHTIPEGKHLVTRSYVLNTLEFERNRTQKESAEQSIKNTMEER